MTGYAVRGNALQIPLADESVDLIITSPPYFALRSYRDGDEHYGGQIGSESSPQEFLEALWAVMHECWRVLKPTGSCWVNLGDKYAGSGGHNNGGLAGATSNMVNRKHQAERDQTRSTRRNAPDRYNQTAEVRAKSLMGLPWSFANGCTGAWPFGPGLAAPDGQTWILRAEIVWDKPNSIPESVTDRVRRSHEQWFHLTKQPRYFEAIDEIREPHLSPDVEPRGDKGLTGGWHQDEAGRVKRNHKGTVGHSLGRLPGSVWTIASEPLMVPDWARERWNLPDHFAAFPQEWPRKIILGWSPNGICTVCGEGRRPVGNPPFTGYACACPDDSAPTKPSVCLDPFGGTGTVAMVANALGRTGVSLDLSADYCRLADWRINHSGHAKKAEQRTWKDRQGSML